MLQSGSLILIIAFLPMAAYLGHWGQFTDYAFGRAGHERPADPDHASHEGHCHGTATCSDQAQLVGVRVFPTVVEVAKPSLVDFVVEDEVFLYREFVLAPPTEPPRL